jgi:hypothetical protein
MEYSLEASMKSGQNRTTEKSALINEIKQLRPNEADAIDQLISLREIERRLLGDSSRVARLNEQRDSLGLSLDIARLDRSPIMKSIQVNRVETAQSILDLLESIPIQERSLLEHDSRIFTPLLGAEEFRSAQFSDDSGRSVRVHITDKNNLESILGIDLIIYSICYDTFLLLQYKGMDKKDDGWIYTVDTHMQSQMKSMSAFRSAVAV